MFLINNIKRLLGIKEVPVIESIQTYEDVNLFLEGYKNYFEYEDFGYWFFAFGKTGQRVLIKKFRHYYGISDQVSNYKELFIRAFIWNRRDEINEELLSRKKAKSDAEKEFLRRTTLEEQIKNTVKNQ
jgi:hypothetical protein